MTQHRFRQARIYGRRLKPQPKLKARVLPRARSMKIRQHTSRVRRATSRVPDDPHLARRAF